MRMVWRVLFLVVIVVGSPRAEHEIAFNAGSDEAVSASDRLPYLADQPMSETRAGFFGGYAGNIPNYFRSLVHHDGALMDGPLYRTLRRGSCAYRAFVEPGLYEVTLRFIEDRVDGPGLKSQEVSIAGSPFIAGLDVYERVGKLRSLDLRRMVWIDQFPVDFDFDAGRGVSSIAAM